MHFETRTAKKLFCFLVVWRWIFLCERFPFKLMLRTHKTHDVKLNFKLLIKLPHLTAERVVGWGRKNARSERRPAKLPWRQKERLRSFPLDLFRYTAGYLCVEIKRFYAAQYLFNWIITVTCIHLSALAPSLSRTTCLSLRKDRIYIVLMSPPYIAPHKSLPYQQHKLLHQPLNGA